MTEIQAATADKAYTEWEHWDNVAWLKGCAA